MITFPKFQDFSKDEQKVIVNILSGIARFEENLKTITSADLYKVFPQVEADKLFIQWMNEPYLSITDFGRKYFTKEQGKQMVKYIKEKP